MELNEIRIDFKEYPRKGLYLIIDEIIRLELTETRINQTADRFWEDEEQISKQVREASEFQKCGFCPVKNSPGMCPAIRPVLPFLKGLDKYSSYDRVAAVYRGDEEGVLHVANTSMQQGLKYVSILSLMHHCANNQKYFNYFFGIVPVMKAKDIAARIYLNMYWVHRGNTEEINKLIAQFDRDLRVTTKNQLKRVELMCKNDAFINALYDTEMITEFLSLGMERVLEEAFIYAKD